KGMEYSVNASQYDYKLARREYWPDFTFSLSYMHMKNNAEMEPSAEKDFLSGSVGIEIPLYFWTKERKLVQEKKYELESSLSDYQGMKNDLKYDISMLYYSLIRHQKEIELYKTAILPQARQSLESARSGYQVDKIDFLTLLENQVTLYNYQISYYQALSLFFQTIARLEEMVGNSLL
ncbi:MAG: TolC family protein, partial [candidate division Zixibacteria bacterium]|nr:TolC family protein [candidate division Zixibacteria bacterium]